MSPLRTLKNLLAIGFACAATHAVSQTTANGPHYATPSWDQTLSPSSRFVVLSNFANAAVLDRETGLVWQQSPPDSQNGVTFEEAETYCWKLFIGGRYGWRLPSLSELTSLGDKPAPADGTRLTSGPFTFTSPKLGANWTTAPEASGYHWVLQFGPDGYAPYAVPDTDRAATAWCVRGSNGSGGLRMNRSKSVEGKRRAPSFNGVVNGNEARAFF